MVEEFMFIGALLVVGILILAAGAILAVLAWLFIWVHIWTYEIAKEVWHGIVSRDA